MIEDILGKSSSSKQAQISPFLLDISSDKLESKYMLHVVKKYLTFLRSQYLSAFVFLLVFSTTQAIIEKQLNQIFFVNFGITVCVLSTFMISCSRAFEVNIKQFAWIVNFLAAVIAAFNSLVRGSDHSMLSILITTLTTTNYCITFRNTLAITCLELLWCCVSLSTLGTRFRGYLWTAEPTVQVETFTVLSLATLICLIKIVALFQRHAIEKLIKREFISGSVLQSRSNLTTDLLKLLLPSFVLEQMKSYDITGENIGDDGLDAGDVTILFCDIADFDKVIKLKEKDIVRMLDSIFRRFDELCKENGVQKIETVGKTYMACGGLKSVEQNLQREIRQSNNPTARVLTLAKQMMAEIKNYDELNLKIGIHRGKCMMGVIGYHKPQFSLIGDAVNTTSRHCTTGDKGHIMVSQEAWAFISQTNIKERGYSYLEVITEMKGKGKVPVFHVVPFQGLIKKRLVNIVERFKQQGKELPSDLDKLNGILHNTRQELKRKLINSKYNNILNSLMVRVNNEVKNEFKKQVDEVIKPENISSQRHSGRKKTVNSQGRSNKRIGSRLLQGRQNQIEVQVEQVEESSSDEEDGEVGEIDPVWNAQA